MTCPPIIGHQDKRTQQHFRLMINRSEDVYNLLAAKTLFLVYKTYSDYQVSK